MITAHVGLGSNLGDRQGNLEGALRALSAHPKVRVLAASPVYETDPAGVLDQPRFLNAAARLATPLDARALLKALLDLEGRLGRVRERKWGPRIIDLDLLLCGDEVISEEGLVVPHPLLTERAFVLAPLCDLDGPALHPVLKRSLRDLYADLCGDHPLTPVGRLNWEGQ